MLGVFVARDIILFYVFFEFTLIPLFFLIGIWGSEERRYAAVKFFLFTLAGSVLTFLGLLAIVLWDYYHPSATGACDDVLHPRADRRAGGAADRPGACSCGSSWRCSPALPSRCRCSRCTPGCRWPTSQAPDGRQRDPGRRAAEDRHLRLRAVQPAHAARRPRPRCMPWLLVACRWPASSTGRWWPWPKATSSG